MLELPDTVAQVARLVELVHCDYPLPGACFGRHGKCSLRCPRRRSNVHKAAGGGIENRRLRPVVHHPNGYRLRFGVRLLAHHLRPLVVWSEESLIQRRQLCPPAGHRHEKSFITQRPRE